MESLDWLDGQPYSRRFGDVYFSRASGVEETRHVFLQHNQLGERWRKLNSGTLFTIAETGFGTGLNFLCAWQLWHEIAPANARLHFVSTEKYPLSHHELAQALALWPELAALSASLLEQYHAPCAGWRRLTFDDGRVTLTLLIGDARETLHELRASVDAWFLDGFAPAKNPEMWQDDLFESMARLSTPNATFATFTAAGAVKRSLQAAGFQVEKVAGHGTKREMLCGTFTGPAHAIALPCQKNAVVIGGGISGTSSAYSLGLRGWQVTLIERNSGLAQEASGNPQGMLYARLTKNDIPLSRLALTGYLYTLNLLARLLPRGTDWDACGLLQLAFDAREQIRQVNLLSRDWPTELVHAVDCAEASAMAGFQLPSGGLHFPGGGWVRPPVLCEALATHPNITLKTTHNAVRLVRDEAAATWQIWDAERCLAIAPLVVIATANDTRQFPQTAHLPLETVRGQVTRLSTTAASSKLAKVICTDGYITPTYQGTHCLGATFTPEDVVPEIREADNRHNLETLRTLSPALFDALNGNALVPQSLEGRAALRCASPDYLPLVGPLLDAVAINAAYASGELRGHKATSAPLPWLDGLYVNTGHGSKGLVSAPLCAELIAAMVEGESLPIDASLARVLDPNRFLLRGHGLKRLVGAAIG